MITMPKRQAFYALLLSAATLLPAPASAQDGPRDVDSILADQRVKRMTTALTLTDDQKTKIRPLVLDEIKAFKSFRNDTTLKEEDRIKKEKEFRDSAKPKFKAILSDEQFTKYEALEKDKRVKKPAAK